MKKNNRWPFEADSDFQFYHTAPYCLRQEGKKKKIVVRCTFSFYSWWEHKLPARSVVVTD